MGTRPGSPTESFPSQPDTFKLLRVVFERKTFVKVSEMDQNIPIASVRISSIRTDFPANAERRGVPRTTRERAQLRRAFVACNRALKVQDSRGSEPCSGIKQPHGCRLPGGVRTAEAPKTLLRHISNSSNPPRAYLR